MVTPEARGLTKHGLYGINQRRVPSRSGGARHSPLPSSPIQTSISSAPRHPRHPNTAVTVAATVLLCLVAYCLLVFTTTPDFSTAMDLEAKYRVLLSAHEETSRMVDAIKSEALQPAAKVDASLSSLQHDLENLSHAVELAAHARKARIKAQGDLTASVKKLEADASATTAAVQEKVARIHAKTQEHLVELRAMLDTLQKEFGKVQSRDMNTEFASLRKTIMQEAVAEAIKEIKSEESRVSASVKQASSAIVGAVKKELMAEVKEELRELLARHANDQVAEAVLEHKSASSVLTWFDSGKGKPNDERMETAVKSVLAKLYRERLGQVDWLLGVNGARIEDASTSKCDSGSLLDSAFCRVAPSLSAVQLNPAALLQGDVQTDTTWLETSSAMLGNCWAMRGAAGYITVALARPVRPSEFVVQHAPVPITIDSGRSAPRNFRILGRLAAGVAAESSGSNSSEGGQAGTWVRLVEGEYQLKDISAESSSLTPHMQAFKVQSSWTVDGVKFEVLDNHGGDAFTCLYHLRMYGSA